MSGVRIQHVIQLRKIKVPSVPRIILCRMPGQSLNNKLEGTQRKTAVT